MTLPEGVPASFGWVPPTIDQTESVLSTLPHPTFRAAAPGLMFAEKPTDVYLWKCWKDVMGSYPAYVSQEIGDCTSFAAGHGVDMLECIEVALDGEEQGYEETCTEAIYGLGRHVAGMLGPWDGCYGAAVAKAVTTYGTIARSRVGAYSGERARRWGMSGVPDDVRRACLEHRVKTTSLVQTWAELVAAISNGYPVIVCSRRGFRMERNDKGICEAHGNWAHAMLIGGIMYVGTPDECAVILQSWGPDKPTGPTPNDMPGFAFGARATVVGGMLGLRDSYALSGFDGYPPRKLPGSWTFGGWSGF